MGLVISSVWSVHTRSHKPNDDSLYINHLQMSLPQQHKQYNLTDAANPQLLRRVLTGEIPLAALCRMTPEELASAEAKEQGAELARKALLVRGSFVKGFCNFWCVVWMDGSQTRHTNTSQNNN